MIINSVIVLIAYLLGSISSAVIVCKIMNLDDPRHHGSRNPGATNVLRLHGKKPALLTLTGDLIKGLLPVLIAHQLNTSALIISMTALAAFIGHLYPVFFEFKGGKGVATLIGVLLGMNLFLGLSFIITWLLIAILFRYSSLSALVASLLTPIIAIILQHSMWYIISTVLMSLLLIWRHRSNIRNLLAGTEDKIGINKI